jgi:Competence protein J (ComJ)
MGLPDLTASSEFEIYFAYSQFLVYDVSVDHIGSAWTETHSRQGFARRESYASIGTLLEDGKGIVKVYPDGYVEDRDHARVISIPFYSPTGQITVTGPEEFEPSVVLQFESTHFRLTVAQRLVGEEQEMIELYFEEMDRPLGKSEILVADDELDPPETLLEHADVPEV